MKRLLVLLSALLVGAAGGFVVGTRVGTYEFILADAQYKASLLASELQSIRNGRLDTLLTGKEIALNGELARHGEYLESRLQWIWPELAAKDDRAIRRAVAYRLAHPYQGPQFARLPGADKDEFTKHLIEGQRIETDYLGKVMERYK